MNPLRISILAAALIGGLLTTLLVLNQNNMPATPSNDEALAEKSAVDLAAHIDENLSFLNKSVKSLSTNDFWQSAPVTEWPTWLNEHKPLYKAAGISLLGVHSVENNVLTLDKQSLPGKFLELGIPLERLYKSKQDVNLLQLFRGSPAVIYLTAIKGADNKPIGSLISIKYLDETLLKEYHQSSQLPVAVLNGSELKSVSLDSAISLADYEMLNVTWPQKIDSPMWKLVLLVPPKGALSLSLIYLLTGLFLTAALIFIIWKQIEVSTSNFKKLSACLNPKVSLTEQISELTTLQNKAHEQSFVDTVQAIRLRLEQAVQQQKSLNVEIRKLKENTVQLKRTASSLSNERDSAIAAPRLKSEFLSRMGDEITTPMKSVVSMLKLLSEYQLEAEAKQILNIAKRSTRTLVDNLNNILDFSKLDAQMLRLKPTTFSVRELIDDLSSELSHYANEKELSLQASSDADLPSEVKADKSRIRQILRNLLGNAIRFTKSGEVSLYSDLITIEGKQLLRFTVKDTGVGIPQEAQAGLFDSLEQSSKLTNSSFAGRLRLIVSKNLAELMGGEIGVISETGKGSEFWFTIALE